MLGIIGERGLQRSGEDDVAHPPLREDVCPIQPSQPSRNACAVGNDGDVLIVYLLPGRLNPPLPFIYALAAGRGGRADGGIADRPAVYPHFGFVGIADEQQGEVFQFLALHGGRVGGKKDGRSLIVLRSAVSNRMYQAV